MQRDDRVEPDPGRRITPRQRQVLGAHLRGLSAKEIAHEMGISVYTVNQHLRELRAKLDARNAHHLATRAIELGLVEPPPA